MCHVLILKEFGHDLNQVLILIFELHVIFFGVFFFVCFTENKTRLNIIQINLNKLIKSIKKNKIVCLASQFKWRHLKLVFLSALKDTHTRSVR